jgi:hypothetical protein
LSAKSQILFAIFVLAGYSMALDANRANVPPSSGEATAIKEMVAKYYRNLPLDRQPVRYVRLGDDRYAPSQFDPHDRIEYRWKGVILKAAQILGFEEDGSFGIKSSRPSGFGVKEMPPPVRYFALGEPSLYRPGYYDAHHGIFYQWQDVALGASQLPPGATETGLILPASTLGRISSVEPPLEYRTRVPGARNVLPDLKGSRLSDVTMNHGQKRVHANTTEAKTRESRGVSGLAHLWLFLALGILAAAWVMVMSRSRKKRVTGANPDEKRAK